MLKTGANLKERKITMAKYGTKAGFDSMASSGLKLLSNDELDTLHYATLQVLKNTGVRVESRPAADLFQSGGASVHGPPGRGQYSIRSEHHYVLRPNA
jgi:trimethylamine:corrinoid methyltransferase-like protein